MASAALSLAFIRVITIMLKQSSVSFWTLLKNMAYLVGCVVITEQRICMLLHIWKRQEVWDIILTSGDGKHLGSRTLSMCPELTYTYMDI
ncbi:hypothetical protein OG21DRAFT_933915 [Imleria badia]|nr:hypothetical protein OG21DRAFT_933915 [Imleria badia]